MPRLIFLSAASNQQNTYMNIHRFHASVRKHHQVPFFGAFPEQAQANCVMQSSQPTEDAPFGIVPDFVMF
jgi:hypothetical protein